MDNMYTITPLNLSTSKKILMRSLKSYAKLYYHMYFFRHTRNYATKFHKNI